MTTLPQQTCTACRGDAVPLTKQEIEAHLKALPEWDLAEADEIPQLVRTYRFDDFAAALAFTNQVGTIAESADHHPAITTEWDSVTVSWWTHKIKGLHLNDCIMAARTDQLFLA